MHILESARNEIKPSESPTSHIPAPYPPPQALAGMRSLGLQNSLTCEGVLQSARSIEAAFAPPVPALNGAQTTSVDSNNNNTESFSAVVSAREAAAKRSRKLLDFVDHRADQLLRASGESGSWFLGHQRSLSSSSSVAAATTIAVGGRQQGKEEEEEEEDIRKLSVSSASESGSDYENGNGDGKGGYSEDEEEREHRRGAAKARRTERKERERENKERVKKRIEAAAKAMQRAPMNDFVEELTTIAWLPVHAKAPNDLLPWKVGPMARCYSSVLSFVGFLCSLCFFCQLASLVIVVLH